jgi:GNAT superfamily N-acetyltransferase
MGPAITVRALETAAGRDGGLVERIASLINSVYAAAENGLWRAQATRTTPAAVARFVEAEEMAVAMVGSELAGVVRVQAVSEVTAEFGLLAVDPDHRGLGVGRGLISFAERHSRERGLRVMQLELLVPRTGRHPDKVFLDDWYRRIGYRVVRRTSVEDLEPELAPLLATPCEFVVYEKPLGGDQPALAPGAGDT